MDRSAGMIFSSAFGLIGVAFAPFETHPMTAAIIASVMVATGAAGVVYFNMKKD